MDRTGLIRPIAAVITAGAILVSGAAPVLGSRAPASAAEPGSTVVTTAACAPGSATCPSHIVFARGAYSGQARGTLSGMGSEQWFSLRARAGQTLVVVVKGAGPTRGTVYEPNGTSSGQPGGRIFDGPLPATGEYRIRVVESPMGEAWSGKVDVVALIY